MKICIDCKKPKSRKGLYCKQCGYRHRKRPSGLVYKVVCINKGWFTKGRVVNKARKHHSWKGNKIRYDYLHKWVKWNKVKRGTCEVCKLNKKTFWANKSHEYKRELKDWLELCGKCHGEYDKGKNWGKAKLKYANYGKRK